MLKIFQGSIELRKLEEDVIGVNGQHLEDLEHMDGKMLFYCINFHSESYFRVCSYVSVGVS